MLLSYRTPQIQTVHPPGHLCNLSCAPFPTHRKITPQRLPFPILASSALWSITWSQSCMSSGLKMSWTCYISCVLLSPLWLKLFLFYRASLDVCEPDDGGNRIDGGSIEWPCDGASSWKAIQFRQPDRYEDRRPHSDSILPDSIDAGRKHAHMDQDLSGPQTGSGRL